MTKPLLYIAVAACQYPASMLDRTPFARRLSGTEQPSEPFMDRPGPADASRRRLRDWRPHGSRRVVVSCGDSIYIDATAGLFDPVQVALGTNASAGRAADVLQAALDRSYEAYERNLFKGSGTVLRAIDDHEIVDNLEPSLQQARNAAITARLDICRKAFGQWVHGDVAAGLWRNRTINRTDFFIADTRTERCARCVSSLDYARIMSVKQFDALLEWLNRRSTEPDESPYRRMLVSPSILLPRRLSTAAHPAAAMRADNWEGYPRSFHDLLAAVAERPGLRLVSLSGDEHLPCVVQATVARCDGSLPAARLLSVHTGAMYAPYPFANSRPEDFADEDHFCFDGHHAGQTRRYRCELHSRWFPAKQTDGFMGIALDADPAVDPQVTFLAANGKDYAWPRYP